ncbi:DUF484 family protein [Jannaschia rubra]|uniref:Recombinase XerC n=1 Tax=Jannaschia rubra TaxID=282197 RepID=A0A0M6XJS4_9RHOB|nr:DUF484 family protein [Jannaschia rubra]CTQ31450.1 hypothetical protein JAN5088_00208 [Jannaschia rubra]SFF79263.1 hypothetical protein SAMN04488517_101209 [Jannaschia rubra]
MADQTARAAGHDWRDRILTDPDMILDDRDLMRALIAANERQMGQNIVDLRGVAMERLEARLDRLEDTHRSVIAAAYENLAGTNQIHRCVLKLLEAPDLPTLLDQLTGDLADIVRVDRVRLVLEATDSADPPHAAVVPVEAGFVRDYITQGRDVPTCQVTLRQCAQASDAVFGDAGDWLQSEALLSLDLGQGRLPGMLVFASEDPHQFRANQGTELLTFLAGALERVLRRHLQ